MLHVDIPTRSEFLALAHERASASVSIYLPTTPVSGEISGDRIVLKNLVKEALGQLEAAGHAKREIEGIAEHIDQLVEDGEFWRFQAHSLAVFATPEKVRTYRLPSVLSAMAEVSDRFHLNPLLRSVTFPQAAYTLALAEGNVRLIEVLPDLPVVRVNVHGLPTSAAEALGRSSMGVRTESRRSDSAAGQRASLVEFARTVDRALRGLLAGQEIPLFLAADPTLNEIYRSVNSYPHLVPFGFEGTPADLNDGEVATATRHLLDRLHASQVDDIRKIFAERRNSGRATSDIAQAARAATHGAVSTLLVDLDHSEPGLIDEETGAVTFADTESAGTYGVVDEIARRALLTGARVLAVRAADLPDPAPLAAILRYAF